jgi:hypothetical protein
MTRLLMQRLNDMNGRSQIQGVAVRDKCRQVFLRLSLAGNLEKPLKSLWDRMEGRGYELGI